MKKTKGKLEAAQMQASELRTALQGAEGQLSVAQRRERSLERKVERYQREIEERDQHQSQRALQDMARQQEMLSVSAHEKLLAEMQSAGQERYREAESRWQHEAARRSLDADSRANDFE